MYIYVYIYIYIYIYIYTQLCTCINKSGQKLTRQIRKLCNLASLTQISNVVFV